MADIGTIEEVWEVPGPIDIPFEEPDWLPEPAIEKPEPVEV